MLHAGIDMHKEFLTVTVLDEEGNRPEGEGYPGRAICCRFPLVLFGARQKAGMTRN